MSHVTGKSMSLFMALDNPEEIATLHTGQISTHSLFGFLFLLLQLALTKIQSVNKIILTIKFIAKCFSYYPISGIKYYRAHWSIHHCLDTWGWTLSKWFGKLLCSLCRSRCPQMTVKWFVYKLIWNLKITGKWICDCKKIHRIYKNKVNICTF